MIRTCLYIFLLLPFFPAAQNPDYEFIEHLTENRRNRSALLILHHEKKLFAEDTFCFVTGFNHHLLRNADSAVFYFERTASSSIFFSEACSYQALNLLYKKRYPDAIPVIEKGMAADPAREQLYLLLGAATALLQKDFGRFDTLGSRFDFTNNLYSAEQKYLVKLRQVPLPKKKSPLVAGLLSAAVPGLGKFYAGKKGAGLATLMTSLALAGFATESYFRGGYKSPQFIAFTGIFACFYTGNIVGSVFSVKQQRRSLDGKIHNEILATIHLPVDRIFGH